MFKTANGSTPLRSKLIMAQHADKVNSCSKVVDENGEPLVVHHASKKQFEEFITKNKWGYGAAHFSTEPVRNDWYGNVRYMVFINSKNPLIVNAENRMYDSIPFEGKNYDTFGLATLARERRNDGVIINDVKEFGGTLLTNDILALEPTQIKSATDNNGEFSTQDNNIYKQVVGEQGAGALDAAEEVTVRLDNLAIARQMEKSGKDAKAIKIATGWERGADGKWRYEIMDEHFTELFYDTDHKKRNGITLEDAIKDGKDSTLLKAYPELAKW